MVVIFNRIIQPDNIIIGNKLGTILLYQTERPLAAYESVFSGCVSNRIKKAIKKNVRNNFLYNLCMFDLK